MQKSAFTIIEILVVFSLIAIFSVMMIPSYLNFNRNQEVKQAGLFIKSIIRDTQNRSQSGEKELSSCSPLVGFYGQFSAGVNTFLTGGRCASSDFDALSNKLPSNNVNISAFYNASSYPTAACSEIAMNNGSLRLMFKTISHGVDFFDWDSGSDLGTALSYTKIGIEVMNSAGSKYVIIIGNNGEIYDVAGC